VIIREARPEDNAKLLEIERTSAQEGNVWFTSNREDFFEKMRYFEDGFMLVAEDEKTGDIIGCAGAGFADYWLEGRKQRGVYLFGLRTNPKYRMKVARWLKALIEKMGDILENSEAEFGFGSVKADNIRSIKILRHMNLFASRTLNFYVQPVLRRGKVKGLEIDNDPEISELQEYYINSMEDHDLVPMDLDRNFFPRLKEQKRLKVYRYKSAWAAVWDITGEYDVAITRLSKSLRALQVSVRFLATLVPFVRIPKLNEFIRSWHVIIFEYQDLKDAKKLVKAIHHDAWNNRIHLLNFAEDAEVDHIKKALGPFTIKLPFVLHTIDRKQSRKNFKPVIWPPRI
jgi:hypothetical protein